MYTHVSSLKKRTSVGSIIDSIGLSLFTSIQLAYVSKMYASEVQNGLTQRKKSSVQMLPTYLPRANYAKLIPGEEVVVLEIGGTNIYGARVVINKRLQPIIAQKRRKYLYIKKRLVKRVFSDPLDFFGHILPLVSSLFDTCPHAIAIIYSFPGSSYVKSYGIDMHSSETLPKNFLIPGMSKLFIGDTLFSLLKKKYAMKDIPIVVLNDTPAVLLAESSATVGGVLGTGFNLALCVNDQIYNTESGNFMHIPFSPIVQHIDRISIHPGTGMAEKHISGLYLGQIFQRAIQLCIAQRILPQMEYKHITAEHIGHILQTGFFNDTLGTFHQDILVDIAKRITIRSAQLVGTMIGTIIKSFPAEFTQSSIRIPIEGSVFWGLPNYQQWVKRYMQKVVQKKHAQFIRIEKAGIKGAAVVALTVKK